MKEQIFQEFKLVKDINLSLQSLKVQQADIGLEIKISAKFNYN